MAVPPADQAGRQTGCGVRYRGKVHYSLPVAVQRRWKRTHSSSEGEPPALCCLENGFPRATVSHLFKMGSYLTRL